MGGGTRVVSQELRWQDPVVPRVHRWQPGKITFRELSVPLLPSQGIINPELIALELPNPGLHSTRREKTPLQTAIWNRSCLLLAPIPPTPPNLMGLNQKKPRLLPYFIFSNINERPSRDILFLIKLEEPYSCLWVNAELWGPALALSLTGPVAGGLTSFFMACVFLPFSLLGC